MLTQKFGSALTKRGFKKGNVFAILLPNISEYPIIYYGVISIGGTVTTMNPLYTEDEIAHQLKDATAQHIITIPLCTPGYQIYLGRSDFVRKLRPHERIKQS